MQGESGVHEFIASVADHLGLLQFTYKASRRVGDMTLAVLDLIHNRLDTTGAFVTLLFMDFSSTYLLLIDFLILRWRKSLSYVVSVRLLHFQKVLFIMVMITSNVY